MAVPAPVRLQTGGDIIESVIAKGDLAKLTPDERNSYYREVCRSLGLNPLTQPFAYISLNGQLRLYAKRDATDQLRKLNGISIEIVSQDVGDGLLTVHVRAVDKEGRRDEDLGVIAFPETLKGEARANAILKAVTKAKRRVTLSISGLGFVDETEVDDIPTAEKSAPIQPESTGTVTEEQIEEIQNLIVETASDIPRFCKAFGCASVAELPAREYQRALVALKAKKARQPKPEASQ